VSASKAEKSRFWVAFFLDNLSTGEEFTHGRLHMTLIPWFVSDLPDSEVISSFSNYFDTFRSFDIALGERVIFGGKDRAPVILIKPDEHLTDIHIATLKWFDAVGGRWALKNPHVGADFKPHIRRRPGKRINQAKLTVKSLTLVKARRQEDWVREVAAKAELV